jgi:hypothetical protein
VAGVSVQRRVRSLARRWPAAAPAVLLLAGCGGADDSTVSPPVDPATAQEVVDAATESWRLLNEARLDPDDSAKTSAAIDAYFGSAQEQVSDVLTGYRLNEQRSVTDPSVPATVVPYLDTVIVDEEAGEASVVYCQVDTNVLVRTGTDEVLDDEPDAYRIRVELVRVDGRWLEAGGELLERYEGATACPDEG